AARARMADSRPAPGPFTFTSTERTPCSCASWAAFCAATCAAKGVPLRDPLKPMRPALDQARVFPIGSLMATMVLLNVGETAAVADAAIAVDLHQPLDVLADVLAEIALDPPLVGDDLADPPDFILGEVFDPRVAVHLGLAEDVARARAADPVDVREADFDALVEWKIYACDASHPFLQCL